MTSSNDIIDFWFKETEKSDWFSQSDRFDDLIISKFSRIHRQAVQCELHHWRDSAKGRLAEIILLDQFSRNMFRGSPLSFTYDSLALALSQEAISLGKDQELTPLERSFLYMPFMHSESSEIHKIAVTLYQKNGIESNLTYELKHKEIIDKFGRYPHRNNILNRQSTKEELHFLTLPNSGF